MTNHRPTWDQTRLQQAQIIAKRSLCSRAQVGAVITDVRNRICGEGYNGPPEGFPHHGMPCNIWCSRPHSNDPSPDYTDCPSLHAEANALLAADIMRIHGGTIYVTSHVCYGCAKLIANSGLARVVCSSADAAHSYRNPLASYQFLAQCGIVVELPESPLMMARIRQGE